MHRLTLFLTGGLVVFLASVTVARAGGSEEPRWVITHLGDVSGVESPGGRINDRGQIVGAAVAEIESARVPVGKREGATSARSPAA